MRRRTRTLLFIHLFIAVQIALPLHYYLVRRDPYDERFAWRMFSSIRMVHCGSGRLLSAPPEFRVGDQPVNLYREFHEAWINLSKRGRREIIKAMALELCDRHPGEEVHVRYSCRLLDGTVAEVSAGGWDVCRTREL